MHRLFLPPEQIAGETAHILGGDHWHLARALRARIGEGVLLLDNAGNAYRASLVSIGREATTARIEARVPCPPEPPVRVTVAQALGKGDKLEQVIQHGTEAGASAFLPVRGERSVAGIPPAKTADRVARWRQIAKGAAEQSGRGRIPEVHAPVTFAELLQRSGDSPAFLLHPADGAQRLGAVLRALPALPESLLLAVGPEGGWSPAEVSAAQAANLVPVSLGPRILRTETAALIALSQILFHAEDA